MSERIHLSGIEKLNTPELIALIAYSGVLGATNVELQLAYYSKSELKAACKVVDKLAKSEPATSRLAAEIRASKKIIQRVIDAK